MRSEAADVDTYLTEVPEARRPALTALRNACVELLDGFTETMSYGMATYERDGVAEISWASQKQHIALYVLRSDVVEAHRDRAGRRRQELHPVRRPGPDRLRRRAVDAPRHRRHPGPGVLTTESLRAPSGERDLVVPCR